MLEKIEDDTSITKLNANLWLNLSDNNIEDLKKDYKNNIIPLFKIKEPFFENQPIHDAIIQYILNKNINTIKELLTKGADINSINLFGETPMSMAILHRNIELVDFLIKEGANINIPNIVGETPLITAVKIEHVKLVDSLIKEGANLNWPNVIGDTALHIACALANNTIINLLLNNKADYNITNKANEKPIDVIRKRIILYNQSLILFKDNLS